MKSVGLDLGDRWVGIALSDGLGMTCKPYTTVEVGEPLLTALEELCQTQQVGRLVVGLPVTLHGKESEQTVRIRAQAAQVAKDLFGRLKRELEVVLWDERMTSKWAATQSRSCNGSRREKRREHAVAAAFVLQNYLDYRAFSQSAYSNS